jgi:hypothetical protein
VAVAVKTKDGIPIETEYGKPITVIKYIHDVVVVVAPFGAFVLTPSSVAYVDNEYVAVADIRREGETLRFEPRDAERLKDVIRSYLPDSLPPQLARRGSRIYLGEVEVGTVYVLN